MTPSHYLNLAQLEAALSVTAIGDHAAALQARATSASCVVTEADLYAYRVPELGENGACSLPDQLAAAPYDLAATLGGIAPDTTQKLQALHALVAQIVADTGCGWLGIYQTRDVAGGKALVKLAYAGKPSRAEFPLTAEFAEHSNNSAVGLSGRGRIISDVGSYVAEGGAYYTCDAEVQSEACLPLFADDGRIVGIIDAEDNRQGFFTDDVLARLVALCLVAPGHLPD
ncbi:GAF domain-containing protein [Chitinimonas sp. BJYL2]|uniref:GAF domain-containing protein n=1 Tax=Chitinimonas sp. BJYL2 TaxID=2976696 RepID=UPI0022B35348|nr:GAF domain-containing protein [Chitinimonas sp. BJYL2]